MVVGPQAAESWGGPFVDGAAVGEPACLLSDGRARVLDVSRLQCGACAAIRVDELASQFGGHRADMRVRVGCQVPHRGVEDLTCARCAAVAFATIAGQSMERGDPDPGVGIVSHGDQLTHRLGVDQVVKKTAAALTNGRILVIEARMDGAHRVFAAPPSSR